MKKINYDLPIMVIDTMEITTPTYITGTYPFLSHDSSRRMTMDDGVTPKYKYRVNPSKTFLDISTFEGYSQALNQILQLTSFTNPVKTRIDFAFDFYGVDYEQTGKRNKLLLLLLANKYDLHNRYQSVDMLTTEQKTLRVSNQSIEIEAYNKILQEPNSCIGCRVEFRSKRLYDDTDEDNKELRELDKWLERMGSALTAENFNCLVHQLTNNIIERYIKESTERNFDKMAFLYKYEDYIFTSRQFKDICICMGYSRPDKQLTKYRKKYGGAEFFSLRQMRDYTLIFKAAADKFAIECAAQNCG